jgi:hypothetical protein
MKLKIILITLSIFIISNKNFSQQISKENYTLKINNSNSELTTNMKIGNSKDGKDYILQCYSSSLHEILAKCYNITLKRIVSTDKNSNLFGINLFAQFPKKEYSKKDYNDIIIEELKRKYKFTTSIVHEEKEDVWVVQVENENLLMNSFEDKNTNPSTEFLMNCGTGYRGFSLKNIFLDIEKNYSDVFFKVDLSEKLSKKKFSLDFYFSCCIDNSNANIFNSQLQKYGLKISKRNTSIEKQKLVFSQKISSIFDLKKELSKLEKSYKKKYNIENMFGKWSFSFTGNEAIINLLKNQEGQLYGNLFDEYEGSIPLKEVSVKGNKISFSITLDGEKSNFKIWFLNKKTAKGVIGKRIFIELKKF